MTFRTRLFFSRNVHLSIQLLPSRPVCAQTIVVEPLRDRQKKRHQKDAQHDHVYPYKGTEALIRYP